MNIAHLLRRSAETFSKHPAVYRGAQLLFDYQTLAHRAATLAAHMRSAAGVEAGDRVLLFSSNVPEYLESLQAIYWLGAVSVPVNYKLHAKELAFVLGDAEPAAVLVSADLAASARDAGAPSDKTLILGSAGYERALQRNPISIEERRPDDLASLFYTSGTTGRPKGVMQSHRNLMAMTSCYFTDVDDVDSLDAMVYAAPMSHGAGLYSFAHLLRGARHVVPESGGFDPAELLELASKVGRLSFFAAPTMVRRLVHYAKEFHSDVSGIKTVVYGGGPMYLEDIKAALDVLGPRLVQIYGQGESPMTITALPREVLADSRHPRWEQRIASVGIAQSLVEVRVVDADDKPVATGEVGEVVVRGDTVMSGYWRNTDASATTLKNRWLHTGDVGCFDVDGFLTLRDRSKDLIISGGSNIYPREVEEVLLQHPSVAEVAVVGKRDADWGEIVVAFIVLESGHELDVDALNKWCLENLARFKRPKEYRVLPSLPKNSYGKIPKTGLRALLTSPEN